LDPDLKEMNPPFYHIRHVVPKTKIPYLSQVERYGMS
jgi:hypothetical protein